MEILTLKRPDDMHLHLREGELMRVVLADTVRQFARAIVMPNLKSPVSTTARAQQYFQHIIENLPENVRQGNTFNPLMTLYLTDNTTVEEIIRAGQDDNIYAVKYYPAGVTTNSDNGVTDIAKVYAVLEAMVEHKLPLLMHGEVFDPDIDIFDREAVFIEKILSPLIQKFPDLRIVLEHISTKDAADFVYQAPDTLAATITPQHLLLNRNALFDGGFNPHHYCLPVLKSETHRYAISKVATSGNAKFFLGTDSAPHLKEHKESGCGCAGIYSAHSAIELYAEVFEQAGCLDKLEKFASDYGADFYGLPKNEGHITLEKQPWEISAALPVGNSELIPLAAGKQCTWRIRQ